MVEVLGVLAVIGVLSVAGIAGFKNAMDKNKANTIINEAQKRATLVVPQIQLMGNENPTITEFINNDLGYGEFDTKVYTNKADNLPTGQFGIKVSGVSKDICQNILNTIGDNTVIRRLSTTDAPTTAITTCAETNTFLMVYNNDMSSNAVAGEFGYDDCPESFYQCPTTHSCVAAESDCPAICELNEELSTGCVCPEHRDTTGGVCGNCVSEVYENDWSQPSLTGFTTYGELSASTATSGGRASDTSCNGDSHPAWCAFDGNAGSGMSKWMTGSSATIDWHIPTKLKILSFKAYTTEENYNSSCCLNRFPTSITLYGSNNGVEWTELCSKSNYERPSSRGFIDISSCASDGGVTYLRWSFENDGSIAVSEIKITAKEASITTYAPDSETLLCE